MHGERDLLTRFVFPELRALGRQHFINVFEVDLRWGVTEEATSTNRSVRRPPTGQYGGHQHQQVSTEATNSS